MLAIVSNRLPVQPAAFGKGIDPMLGGPRDRTARQPHARDHAFKTMLQHPAVGGAFKLGGRPPDAHPPGQNRVRIGQQAGVDQFGRQDGPAFLHAYAARRPAAGNQRPQLAASESASHRSLCGKRIDGRLVRPSRPRRRQSFKEDFRPFGTYSKTSPMWSRSSDRTNDGFS